VGAVVITLLPELLRGLESWWAIVYALGIIGFLILLPEGLVGYALRLFGRFTRRRPPDAGLPPAVEPGSLKEPTP
jgi:branched-chain amino acid transport system permease protein